jgi:hypothetical protein
MRVAKCQPAHNASRILPCRSRCCGKLFGVANKLAPPVKKPVGVRALLYLFYAVPVVFVLGVTGYLGYGSFLHKPPPVRKISGPPFVTVKIKDLTANLFTEGNTLRAAGNDLFIEFRDAHGVLIDVGDVTFELGLKMPDLVMHSLGKVLRTSTPGQYRTTVEPQMAGDWTAKITISGSQGTNETSFPLKVI